MVVGVNGFFRKYNNVAALLSCLTRQVIPAL